jgi:hypothetical protein
VVLSRPLLPLLLTVCLAALPLAPIEHVHAETAGDRHPSLVIHRHSAPHHHGGLAHHAHEAPQHQFAHRHDDAGLAPGEDHDDDGVVLTLEPIFAAPHAYVLAAPLAVVEHLLLAPPRVEASAAAVYVERIIHAPPRAPAVLRGPPVAFQL